jgi:hypothetical protein
MSARRLDVPTYMSTFAVLDYVQFNDSVHAMKRKVQYDITVPQYETRSNLTSRVPQTRQLRTNALSRLETQTRCPLSEANNMLDLLSVSQTNS